MFQFKAPWKTLHLILGFQTASFSGMLGLCVPMPKFVALMETWGWHGKEAHHLSSIHDLLLYVANAMQILVMGTQLSIIDLTREVKCKLDPWPRSCLVHMIVLLLHYVPCQLPIYKNHDKSHRISSYLRLYLPFWSCPRHSVIPCNSSMWFHCCIHWGIYCV